MRCGKQRGRRHYTVENYVCKKFKKDEFFLYIYIYIHACPRDTEDMVRMRQGQRTRERVTFDERLANRVSCFRKECANLIIR